jgi:hypothetical protein
MKIQLIKPLETGKRYETCMSCSLYEIKGSLKFDKYFASLRNIIYTSLNTRTFLRLYVDESVLVKPEFQKWIMNNKPNLEVYKYEDERFLLEDGIHHDGSFGMMPRFLPFFDKDLDVDFVWVSDVDMKPEEMTYKYINEMKKNKAPVGYSSRCYLKAWIPKNVDYTIINSRLIISKDVEISRYGFDKFLKDAYEGNYKELKETIQGKHIAKAHEQDEVKIFIYGFDEMYTNTSIFEKVKKYIRLIEFDIGLFPLKWYHKNKELVERSFFNFKNDVKNKEKFIKLFNLYEEIAKEFKNQVDSNEKICVNNFNKYKGEAKEKKSFVIDFLINP